MRHKGGTTDPSQRSTDRVAGLSCLSPRRHPCSPSPPWAQEHWRWWAAAGRGRWPKAFGREQSATGLQSDGWGVTALLLSIGIIAVAGAVAFVPAVKQLTWPMFVVAGLGLVNLIISIVVASNVQSVNVVGLVQAGMGWGLILLLIASIAVIALAVVQALQTLKAAKNAHPFPPSSGGMGNPYQGGGQPQGYQNQGPSGAHHGPQGYPH